MEIKLDEGFLFGLGVFETIAVEHGYPILLEKHLKRLKASADFLGISSLEERGVTKEVLQEYIDKNVPEHGVLKIVLSKENHLLQARPNPYTEEQYQRGFVMDFSKVCRNETSPLVFHKTMNYGDCIHEKRKASLAGMNERIFLNTKGQIAEGTVSNIFFVKNKKIYTPALICGMLPGVMREYVCELTQAEEKIIYPEDLKEYEECFVTNSLMGIMPVKKLDTYHFVKNETAIKLLSVYKSILP